MRPVNPREITLLELLMSTLVSVAPFHGTALRPSGLLPRPNAPEDSGLPGSGGRCVRPCPYMYEGESQTHVLLCGTRRWRTYVKYILIPATFCRLACTCRDSPCAIAAILVSLLSPLMYVYNNKPGVNLTSRDPHLISKPFAISNGSALISALPVSLPPLRLSLFHLGVLIAPLTK